MKKRDSLPPSADSRLTGLPDARDIRDGACAKTGQEGESLRQVACSIRSLPDIDPPVDLVFSVMQAIRGKKRPWWFRLHRWAKTPKSITFTPVRLVPFALMVLLTLTGAVFISLGPDRSADLQMVSQHRIPVTLSLRVPDAQSVAVIGSFNNWYPQDLQLQKNNGQAMWNLTVLLPAGRYEYAFLIDGVKVVSDPEADLYQDDGFGNVNTVLVVGTNDEKTI